MLDYLINGSDSFSNFLESDFCNAIIFIIAIILILFPIFYSIYSAVFSKIISSKRLIELEHRIDNLEGYFKFNPDGTVTKVSDLDIDCETVDINKPTK